MEGAIIMESTLAQNCFIFFQRAGIRSSSSQKNCRLVWLKEEIERGSKQRAIVFQICLLRNGQEVSREQIFSWRAPKGVGKSVGHGIALPNGHTHNMNTAIIAGFDTQHEISCWLA